MDSRGVGQTIQPDVVSASAGTGRDAVGSTVGSGEAPGSPGETGQESEDLSRLWYALEQAAAAQAKEPSAKVRGDKWVRCRFLLSSSEYAHLREAVQVALEVMAIEGCDLPAADDARFALGLNRVCVEWLSEGRFWLSQAYARALDTKHDVEERMGKLAALSRDDWRCRICGHTYAGESNGIMVGVHHIIPRSYFPSQSDRIPRPGRIHHTRNLISLCSKCHELCHRNWREAAVGLFGLLGDDEMVRVFRRAGYGESSSDGGGPP